MDCVTSPMRGQGFFSWPKGLISSWCEPTRDFREDSKKRETVQIKSPWEVPCWKFHVGFERCSDIIHLSYTKKEVKTKAFLCFFSTHQPQWFLFVFTLFLGCCSNHQFALRHVLQLHDFWIIALLWKVIVEHHIIGEVDPTKGPKKGIVMLPENLRVFLKPTRFVCVCDSPPKKKTGVLKNVLKKNGWEQRQKRKDSLR